MDVLNTKYSKKAGIRRRLRDLCNNTAPVNKSEYTETNEGNAFDYLTELPRHSAQLKKSPADWTPWNYRETLLGAGAGVNSS